MAQKIQQWVSTLEGAQTSKRDYDTFTVTAIQKADDGDYYNGSDRGVNLTVYRDEQTGILTTDPHAFEKLLDTFVTRA